MSTPPSLLTLLRSDHERIQSGARSTARLLRTAVLNASFRTAVLHRVSSRARIAGLGRLIAGLNLAFHGADIDPRAHIAGGVFFAHPVGIVIGGGVRIGVRCTIMGGVTLGRKNLGSDHDMSGYPVLGDDVILGTHCSVLGSAHVGDHGVVGAHSLVLKDVGAGQVVTGIPATPRES